MFNGKLVTIHCLVLIARHIKLNHRVGSCDRIKIFRRLVGAFGKSTDGR